MTGVKRVNRLLHGLPNDPDEQDELNFLNGIERLIPASARIHELFSHEFIQWAKDTLLKTMIEDDSLNIMALWSMVNKERNEALKNLSENRALLEQSVAANERAAEVVQAGTDEIKKASAHIDALEKDNAALLKQLVATSKRTNTLEKIIRSLSDSAMLAPGLMIYSGPPTQRRVMYALDSADEMNVNLTRDATGTSFVVAMKGRFPGKGDKS